MTAEGSTPDGDAATMPSMSVHDRIHALALLSDDTGAITRLSFGPAHARAAALVAGWMREAGLAAHVDAAGTVVGRAEGPSAASPLLLLGSHVDTVRRAGAWDGTLGVVAAIEAMRRLRACGTRLPYAVEILAFGDEEGVRFAPTLGGSRAIAGRVDATSLDARDADGITLAAALGGFGGDPDAFAANRLRRDRAFAYLEVHIEQGPVLEAADLPLGVVTAISGATRLAVCVRGRAGHAGTVPMAVRRDALAGAARMVLGLREAARACPGTVATVGRIEAFPGAANVIAAECRFTVDLRAEDDPARHRLRDAATAAFERIAADETLSVEVSETHDAPATRCDARLQAVLARAIEMDGSQVRHLASGAGHDAMAVASLCPVGMLFVRCRGGVSHDPAEHVEADDAERAVAVLTGALRMLSPERFLRDTRP